RRSLAVRDRCVGVQNGAARLDGPKRRLTLAWNHVADRTIPNQSANSTVLTLAITVEESEYHGTRMLLVRRWRRIVKLELSTSRDEDGRCVRHRILAHKSRDVQEFVRMHVRDVLVSDDPAVSHLQLADDCRQGPGGIDRDGQRSDL